MPSTIYDLAKAAGVSIATVSRALNDHYAVSEKTKEKIKRLAEQMDFWLSYHNQKNSQEKWTLLQSEVQGLYCITGNSSSKKSFFKSSASIVFFLSRCQSFHLISIILCHWFLKFGYQASAPSIFSGIHSVLLLIILPRLIIGTPLINIWM